MTAAQVERLKREAKRMRKSEGIQHTKALDLIAKREGFHNWKALIATVPNA